MIDGYGRHLEVIVENRDHGPQTWIRVSRRGVLLGPGMTCGGIGRGYYRTVRAALRHVDVEPLVEVIGLRRCPETYTYLVTHLFR